jgi:hypothetical protein
MSGHLSKRSALVVLALVAFTAGYFAADDTRELRRLNAELERLSERQRGQPSQVAHPFSGGQAFGMPHRANVTSHPSSDQSGSGGLLARANVTEEDMALTRELTERRENGEFVLKSEIPLFRKLQDYDLRTIATASSSSNATEYGQVFTSLGIDPGLGGQLQTHSGKIHLASLEAETAISQLLHARQSYDSRMRDLLSGEDYERYRRYEELKPVQDEAQRIREFFVETHGLNVDQQFEQTLIELISVAGVAENAYWHGPYDPLPQVRMGKQEVTAWASEEFRRVIEGAEVIAEQARAAGLPEEYQDLLAQYYYVRAEAKRSLVESLLDPANTDSRGARRDVLLQGVEVSLGRP